jgi:magnesium transporter
MAGCRPRLRVGPRALSYPDAVLLAYCHSPSGGWSTVENLDHLSDLRVEEGILLWAEADVRDLSEKDVALIADEFSLHRLAVEDATETKQRPKLDPYEAQLFVVFHELNEIGRQLEPVQISCFVGERYVLTLHDGAQRMLDEAKRRWAVRQEELGQGPAFLLYTLLDVIVDDYERIADELEEEMENLEAIALDAPTTPIQQDLYSVKQRVARLRRYAVPVSRILEWVRDSADRTGFPEESRPLFRDVYDHLMRITDQVRSIDDLSGAVIDLQRAEQAHQLSEVNKKLTAWAAIIATPTFIASVYGMNFALEPDTGTAFGFWFALVLMAGAAIVLYVYFRRRRWL